MGTQVCSGRDSPKINSADFFATLKRLRNRRRHELFDIPTDEDSLIRHYSLSPADRLEIELRRRKQNLLGFAVQLCLMRYPGRALLPNEVPPPMLLN